MRRRECVCVAGGRASRTNVQISQTVLWGQHGPATELKHFAIEGGVGLAIQSSPTLILMAKFSSYNHSIKRVLNTSITNPFTLLACLKMILMNRHQVPIG